MKQRIPSSPSKVTKVLALSTEADTWMPTQKTFLFVGSLKQEPTLVQVWARNQAQRINHDWHMEVIVSFARECLVGIWPTHFQGNVPEKIFFLIKRGKKCVKKRSPLSSWKLVKRCSCLVLWQPHCENEGKLRELTRRFPRGLALWSGWTQSWSHLSRQLSLGKNNPTLFIPLWSRILFVKLKAFSRYQNFLPTVHLL